MNSFICLTTRKFWHFFSSFSATYDFVTCWWPSAICPRIQSLEYFPKIVPLRNIIAAPNPTCQLGSSLCNMLWRGRAGLCMAWAARLCLPCLPCASLQPWVYPTSSGALGLVLDLLHMQKSYSIELCPFIYKLSTKCDTDKKACFKDLLSTCACCVSFHSWGNVHEEASHHLLLVRIESVANVYSRVLKISGTEKNNETQ